MKRNKLTWLVYIIIGLGVFGLVSQLFTNTASLFKYLVIMTVISLLIFAVIYFLFLRNRRTSNEMKKYKMAVKQSNIKYKKSHANESVSGTNRKYNSNSKQKLNPRASHLRVIDGAKSKGKNRTTF